MSGAEQFFALGGVVIGAGMSFGATYLSERLQWRRSQAVRWDERRLAAYAEYAHIVKRLVNISDRICAGRGLTSKPQPLEPNEENLAELARVEDQRTVLAETLRLMTDPDTDAAALRMTRSAWRIERMARGIDTGNAADFEHAKAEFRAARNGFINAARHSLHVDGEIIGGDYGSPSRLNT